MAKLMKALGKVFCSLPPEVWQSVFRLQVLIFKWKESWSELKEPSTVVLFSEDIVLAWSVVFMEQCFVCSVEVKLVLCNV